MLRHVVATIALCVAVTGCGADTFAQPVHTQGTGTTRPAVAVGPAISCEPMLDIVVCVTTTPTQRIVQWGPEEDAMTTTVTQEL